jgi:hypothetical protein
VGAQVDVAELTEIAGTTATLEASARAVTALAQHRLTAMIEPFWCTRREGRVVNDDVSAAVGVAAELVHGGAS